MLDLVELILVLTLSVLSENRMLFSFSVELPKLSRMNVMCES
jgi:hypothetical protein